MAQFPMELDQTSNWIEVKTSAKNQTFAAQMAELTTAYKNLGSIDEKHKCRLRIGSIIYPQMYGSTGTGTFARISANAASFTYEYVTLADTPTFYTISITSNGTITLTTKDLAENNSNAFTLECLV